MRGRMVSGNEYIWIVMGMGAVTFLPRWAPLIFLSKRRLPQIFVDWLDLVPVSILSALLLPVLVTSGSPRKIDLMRPELWVAVPTLLFAFKTKSLGGTVAVGMLLYWLAGQIWG